MTERRWPLILVSMMLAALVFLPALKGEFVGDDRTIQAYQIPAVKTAGDVNRDTLSWSKGRYYRPLATVTFLIDETLNNAVRGPAHGTDERLSSARAFIPHASTLLMHVLATGLAAMLAIRLLGGGKASGVAPWAAALIFALHPVHGESVSFITARSDILATASILASIIFALDAGNLLRRSASGFFFLLALFAKEAAFPGLFLIPLCLWAFSPENGENAIAKALKGTVPLLAAVAVYAVFRLSAGGFAPPEPYGGEPAILKMLKAASFYVMKIVFPWPTEPFVPYVPGWGETALGLAVLTAAGVAAFLPLSRGTRLYAAMWLWFVAAVIPALPAAAWGMAHTPVAERYLYLPSVAFAMAGGALTADLIRRLGNRKAILAVGTLLLAACAAASWNAADTWRNDITLFETVTGREKTALNPFPLTNLGHAYMREGRTDDAEKTYLKVIYQSVPSLDRYVAEAHAGLGEIALARHGDAAGKNLNAEALARLRDAENAFSEAADLIPDRAEYWKKLSNARLKLLAAEKWGPPAGRTPDLALKTRQALQNALMLDPRDQETLELEKMRKTIAPE